ncbi:MAG: ABC transporter permease [Clostridia bacterium]|nr:ABC transporter permease [Clostridia bacterium]
MRSLVFSGRCAKEILRDPLNLAFGLGFPAVLLLLLSAIQANIPVPLFEIERLAPGIAVFGLAFMTLFSATLVSKDRSSDFVHRLYTTPMRATEFLVGYTLPMIPISLGQTLFCFLFSMIFGLKFNTGCLLAVIFSVPVALLFISLGLLFGSILGDKQVGGICGALLTNLTAWLSGVWFDLDLVGGVFKKVAYALPFVHAVELERAAVSGNLDGALTHLLVVLAYALLAFVAAVLIFLRRMKRI